VPARKTATPKAGAKGTRASTGGKRTLPASRKRRPALPNATPEACDIIYRELLALYPDAHCELDFRSPFELLVATILSAQCTDKRVNMVTPALFRRFPSPHELARARQEEVEEIIKSTGFFRAKAKSLIGMAGALVDRHGGEVPARMEELTHLPGVGRKTANVILGNAFDINVGVVVDTHVGRLAGRLGLTSETDPVKVEQALMRLFPSERWTMLSHVLIWHGRRLCDARKPRCPQCPLAPRCPSAHLPARS
jgi:endonuclease III